MVNIIKTSALVFVSFFLISNSIFAQNEDLKFLDDGGYSKTKNFISWDISKLIVKSISIKYERVFGSSFSVTGGFIYRNPNKNQTFYIDILKVYDQDNREYFPQNLGCSPFIEAKYKVNYKESHFMSIGIGYRYSVFETSYMNDIYGTFGNVYKLNNHIFWTWGGDIGLRLIKFTDIEYSPGYISGDLLKQYDSWYNEAVNKQTIVVRLNLGLGYMF
jgi:hypothetical protein